MMQVGKPIYWAGHLLPELEKLLHYFLI